MDIKPIIAKNLAYLRKENELTQQDIAARLNYSDKAVSRWEQGDTVPDINTLYQICEFYGIDLNVLCTEDIENKHKKIKSKESFAGYRVSVYLLSVSVVFLIATVVFIYSGIMIKDYLWISFIWALPASCVTLYVLGYKNTGKVFKFVLRTIFVWTLITAIFIQFITMGYNIWSLYIIGIPIQIMLVMWLNIAKY